MKNITILSDSKNSHIAEQVAKEKNIKLIKAHIKTFSDSEIFAYTDEIPSEQVIIVHSIQAPVNDSLIELCMYADLVKRAGARQILAIIPYLGYSRQDKKIGISTLPFGLVAKLLEAAGINEIITVELHNPKVVDLFSIEFKNIAMTKFFTKLISNHSNSVIVSPDSGGTNRASEIAGICNRELIVLSKVRDTKTNIPKISDVPGTIKGKDCILVDDIIDSGQTIIKAAEILKQHGAGRIDAYITHAVLSNNAAQNIQNSQIDSVTVTDSILHKTLPTKFKVIKIATLLAQNF